MKTYKCPNCGRTYSSMYCDACGKTIAAKYAVYGEDTSGTQGGALSGADATNELLAKIKRTEEDNNYLLSRIEKHTKIMSIIMVISAIIGVIGAIFILLGFPG